MTSANPIRTFFSAYPEDVYANALKLRETVLRSLPGVIEELDLPAKMVSYSFGRKYSELICVIIPSKKGLKLGFYKGNELPDPEKLLEGTGKISRYVNINSQELISSAAVKDLLAHALEACKLRIASKK